MLRNTNLGDSRRVCSLLLAMSIVGGCATMSESECINADWREVGRNDGPEDKRRKVGKLENQLESLRALTIAEYARSIDRARNLGYPEEFRLDEIL